jgi:hypothetical protein
MVAVVTEFEREVLRKRVRKESLRRGGKTGPQTASVKAHEVVRHKAESVVHSVADGIRERLSIS